MKKIILTLLIPIIVFSQSPEDCENTILQEALINSNVNQYFQIALSLNIEELAFIDNCSSDTTYTMFLPGNNVPNESAALLLGLPGELMDYIPYYIYPESINFIDFINGNLEMMDENTTNISTYQYIDQIGVMVNDANITNQDICTCNGIIHIIDDLIWAPGIININENQNKALINYNFNNTLTVSNIEKNSVLEIINTKGQLLFRKKITTDKDEVNLSHYQSGIYIINLIFNQNRISKLITIN